MVTPVRTATRRAGRPAAAGAAHGMRRRLAGGGASPRARAAAPAGCGGRSAAGLAAAGRRARPATRGLGARRPPALGLVVAQPALDDLQRQEVLALLAQDPAQPLDVGLVELAVARRRALGVEQALALEEADLGDGDVGELVLEERRGPRRSTGRRARPRPGSPVARRRCRKTSLNLPICTSSPLASARLLDALAVEVGAVERADVAHARSRRAAAHELGVAARDGDVVEEDVAVGMAAGPGDLARRARTCDPAFGPRLTTSMPAPSGRSSSATVTSSSAGVRRRRRDERDGGRPRRGVLERRAARRAEVRPGGLRCPQLLQNTSATSAIGAEPSRHAIELRGRPSASRRRVERSRRRSGSITQIQPSP